MNSWNFKIRPIKPCLQLATVPLNFRTFTVSLASLHIYCAQALWVCQANQITWMKLKRNISIAFGEHEPSSSPWYILKCSTRLFVSACNIMQIFCRWLSYCWLSLCISLIVAILQFTAIIFARTETLHRKIFLRQILLHRNCNCQFHVRQKCLCNQRVKHMK